MQITNHAEIRSKQRSIPLDVLHLVLKDGTGEKVPGNATKYHLKKRDIEGRIHELKHQIQMIEKSKRVRVIVANEDETIITAYREKNKIKNYRKRR